MCECCEIAVIETEETVKTLWKLSRALHLIVLFLVVQVKSLIYLFFLNKKKTHLSFIVDV